MKRRVEGERIGLKVGGNTLKMKKQQRKKGTENEERKKSKYTVQRTVQIRKCIVLRATLASL